MHTFTNLSLETCTRYRDVNPQASTLLTLRNGKRVKRPNDLRYIANSKGPRVLKRKDVIEGIENHEKKLEAEAVALAKREAKELAKKMAPEKSSRAKKAQPKSVLEGPSKPPTPTIGESFSNSTSTK